MTGYILQWWENLTYPWCMSIISTQGWYIQSLRTSIVRCVIINQEFTSRIRSRFLLLIIISIADLISRILPIHKITWFYWSLDVILVSKWIYLRLIASILLMITLIVTALIIHYHVKLLEMGVHILRLGK